MSPGRKWRLLASLLVLSPLLLQHVPAAAAAGQTLWVPKVSIVWPHDARGNQATVVDAQAVNVSVWPTNQVGCGQSPNPPVDLFLARNNEPVGSVGVTPQVVQRSAGGVSFPSAEFNDVPANLSADPTAKYRFVAYLNGTPTGNIWTHAADPRTFFPQQLVPTGYSEPHPKEIDTRIQIVFPHDERGNFAPVERATKVNIAADVLAHGTTLSVPPDASYNLRLLWAQGNGPLAQGPGAVPKTTYTVGGRTYPRWVLNDFPVRPDQQYHFLLVVGALGQPGASYPTVWTHGADPRTFLPNPEPPPPCAS